MHSPRDAKLSWLVLLLLGLGGGLGLLDAGYGQEGLPTAGGGAAVLEEAERLSAEITTLYGAGKYAAALPLAQRVVALREQALGPTHPDVATSLNTLAMLAYYQGQYVEAESLYRRALTSWEQALGPTHPDVAVVLNNLAELYRAQGQYAQATPLYQRALTIAEQALGPAHPVVATSLNNLAVLAQAQGQYAQAEPLYRRVLGIAEQALGPTHPDVAVVLNNLAVLAQAQGQYAQAEPFYRRALPILEQALGPSHPSVATSLNNLAALTQAQGQYAQAEPLYRRVLAIREHVLGPTHSDVAQSLNNLAMLYYAQGQYAEAEPLFHRALSIWEQALGPTHPDIAQSLNNLAELYRAQGQYTQAWPFHRRALVIRQNMLGPAHPDVAQSLNNLALLYYDQGQYAEAEPLFHRALSIWEQALEPTHPYVAFSLNNLALLYDFQGQYAKSEPLYRRALSIWEQALGPTHPHIAIVLHNLAVHSLIQGEGAHAVSLMTRSSDINERTLTLMLVMGTEAQKLASAAILRYETDVIVSLHTGFAPHDPQALRLALTTVLRRKGRVLDAMTDTLAAMRRHVPPEEQELLAQWAATRGALATLVFQGLGMQSSASYQAQFAQLDAQAQQLEAQLSARSAAFHTQTQPVTLEQVQAAIPAGAALVELAVYAPFTPRQSSGAPRYVAYVLPPQGPPTWVDLGEAALIDRAVEQFRTDLSGPHRLRVQAAARALDDMVMRPIRPLLGTAHHLLMAPDGALHLIPFGALVDETQHYLVERFTVSYLTTGRDLLRPPSLRPISPPLVVGNPAFDRPGVSSMGQVAAALRAPAARRAADMQALRFPPLPSTAEEVAAVQGLLPESQLWTGTAASEAALKQVQGPRLLHLATHGFFLADQSSPLPSMRGIRLVSPETPALLPEVPRENPLLRAGLALAGANAPQPGAEDGILTALEFASLDLGGTELVVLSACDTGVGQVRTSEGVYGLRRALVMAGADSQVMSLWKVDDDATRELMVAYYHRLQAGEGRAEALRQVQLAMRASPQHGHPFYWAAFLLSGAWTPLTHP